jgi:hypothetical protein
VLTESVKAMCCAAQSFSVDSRYDLQNIARQEK